MYRTGSPVTACPRCQRSLEERAVDLETILVCPSCGGVWLDTAQTMLVFKRLKAGEPFLEASDQVATLSRAERPRTDGPVICPIGGEETILCEAEGIRIDQCPEHGTWFDARELRRIVKTADEPSAITKWLSGLLGRTVEPR